MSEYLYTSARPEASPGNPFRPRAYYDCRRCGRGGCPFDDDAGLTGRRPLEKKSCV
jgi:hypothetical protein